MDGIVEDAGMQLVPILLGEAITVAKGLAHISHVAFVGGFFLLLLGQYAPIDDWTVGNDSFHSWIERGKNGCRAAEAATDHEDLIRRQLEFLAKSALAHTFWQFIDDVAQVLLRRPLQKPAIAFPGSAPARIEDPITFLRQELRQR